MSGGKEAILKGALQVFARKGYSGASIREICEAAGITKPVLYYHFRNKAHLYQELMIDSFGQFLKMLLAASKSDGSLRERLIRIMDTDFRAAKDDPTRIRFIFRMIFSPEEHLPHFNYVEEMERQRKIIAGVLSEGKTRGQLRGDTRDLATVLIGMELIAILENLFTGRSTLTRRHAEKYVDILLQGCAVEG